ncbi:hypothetical protein SPICUR_05780 [Spiribacter curvatus]|uniref:HPt domain-containing protein n=1 Tax=Spiribacter curvatus TaxID=1335757 RepID=U5T3Q2_9GAMM|nr:Hpt domain-containing protein [Spiribacter curvatus]AGY92129.1 hypothetical protein SPICUR_05780 [Spiribacter curvatus]
MNADDFDKEAGLACVEGDEALYEAVLTVFHQQITEEFAELPAALRDGRDAPVARQVHTLKGSAGSVGAKRLEAAASAIDRRLKADQWPLEEALIDELDAALRSAAESLRPMI